MYPSQPKDLSLVSAMMFINYLLSPRNLPTDETTQQFLQYDLWIDLDVILHMGKIKEFGKVDRYKLMQILKEYSPVVEVNEQEEKIRPVWATMSILIVKNLAIGSDVHDVSYILGQNVSCPSMWSPDGMRIFPRLPLPYGIVGAAQVGQTIWMVAFNYSRGAETALSDANDKVLFGVRPVSYVFDDTEWNFGDNWKCIYPWWEILNAYASYYEKASQIMESKQCKTTSEQ